MNRNQIAPMAESRPERPKALADLLIEHLEQIGVQYVFGVPGGAIEPLYDAMARSSRRGGLRPVLARHEAGAAFMADGYARETGKLGVCCSTTGPGATNLITGVASAFADNVPLLVITAQTALPNFGKRALQESSCSAINTVAMFQSCTNFSSLISHRGQLESKLLSALIATQGPPAAPAHLSIPMDILCAPCRQRSEEPTVHFEALFKGHTLTDLDALELLCGELGEAKRIVLILGSGSGEGIAPIMEFAELVNASIVSGPSGKRWIDHFHPQYHGVLGFAGHASATAVLKDERTDLILAVGTRLGELVFSGWEKNTVLQQKLIHIDVNPKHFSRSPMARLHVCGTLSSIFKLLTQRVREARRWGRTWPGEHPDPKMVTRVDLDEKTPIHLTLSQPTKGQNDSPQLKPQRLMQFLGSRFPENTRFIIDAGNSWAWATHYLFLSGSGRYRVGFGFGSMAWGIGAAVGTALGAAGAPVVCLTGDGSFLMSSQELTVAVAEKLTVIFVVLNDQALGMVKHGQRLGGGEPIAFELPPVDFALMAKAMGAQGLTIHTSDELEALDLAAICRRPGPTLLDVYIDPEEVPPMGARMKTLGR